MKTCRVVAAAIIVSCGTASAPGAAWAQAAATSGQIVGQIADTSGAAIVGARVALRSEATNLVRQTISDAAGRYAVSLLPPGSFDVTVEAAGLETAKQTVVVRMGASVSASFTLKVAGVAENVQVPVPALEPAATQAKAVLTDLQLQNLPASGRRVRSLFLFTPATQIEPECGGFAISGQKGVYTSINVDGGDYTNTHWCGHVEFSPTFSIEALQEFQVIRGTFSAEFGRSTGGIINMSTKSGSNLLRGSSFYLFRNDALTMDDPFGRLPIGVGQQFGGSLGGALKKDRTFFFVAPEIQRNTKPVQILYTSLDSQSLRGTAAAQTLLGVAPEQDTEALSQSESVVGRIDHRIGDRHTLMTRVDYIRNRVTDNVGSVVMTQGLGADSITNRALSNQALLTNRNDVTGAMQLSSVLSSRFLNEARAQITHEYRPWNNGTGGPEVTVRNAGATVAIYGPQATGLSYGNIGYRFSDVRTQFVDNVSFVTGAHTAKAGVDVDTVIGKTTFNPGANGIYTFNSLADYVARKAFQYQQFGGSGSVDATISQVAFYVQDEWRLGSGLTLSPGLRYEQAFLPDYAPATVAANRFPLATSIPDDKDLIAPRLGIVWDPAKNGRTVIRAAAGIFYAAPYMPALEQSILGNGGNPDLSSAVTITTSANPNAVADAFRAFGIDLSTADLAHLPTFSAAQLNQLVAPENRIGQTINYIDPGFRLPRAAHLRAALERQLARGLTAGVDFTTINTSRIARVRNINLAPPVVDATGRPLYTAARPYGPQFGVVQVTESTARSNYHGMTASFAARRRLFSIDAYYTLGYSRSADDTERGISGVVFDDAYNLANEYNWSNIDQRHQFAADGMVSLPFRLDLSATVRVNSGRPFSAVVGSDLNKDGVLRDRPVIDGAVIARNTFRNRGYSEVDLRAQRSFALRGQTRAILSLELFNLFNAANVEIGSANMVYGAGTVVQNGVLVQQAPPGTFGQIKDANGQYLLNSALRTAPFQAQLGLRFQF
jgi:Carboxypeptidase regulatory-like domain/TonB dependent receptor-like, beta-barrel